MTWPSRALADPPEDYHAALQEMPPPTREVRMMDSIEEKKKSVWKHSDLNIACHNQMCRVNHPVFAGVCIGCGHWVRKADVPGYDKKPRLENVDVPYALLRAARYHKNRREEDPPPYGARRMRESGWIPSEGKPHPMCFWALPVLPKDHYERVYDADKSRHLRDAAMTGDLAMLKEVLGYENIDVNAKAEDECTALHLAAQNGELKVVEILLDDGRCDVDALEHRDSTAAHLAARQGFTDVVELLATHPRAIGNMALRDYDGRTPADVAYAAGHVSCGDAIAKLTTDALGMRLRKWAAKEAERMLFATKRYSILYGRDPEPYSLPFSFAEEPPIFKDVEVEDEAEAPAPAVDEDDDGFSDGEAVLIEQIVSDADAAAPAPSLSRRTYPPAPTADPEHVRRAHEAAHVALAKVAATAVVLPIFKNVSASVSRGERIDHDPNPDLRERKLLHDRWRAERTVKRALQDEQDRAAARLQAITRGNAERSRKGKRRRKKPRIPPPPPDPRRRVLRKGRSGFALPAAPSHRGRYRSLRATADDSESEYEDDGEPRCRPVLRMKDNVRN
jgi:hypothetical protein